MTTHDPDEMTRLRNSIVAARDLLSRLALQLPGASAEMIRDVHDMLDGPDLLIDPKIEAATGSTTQRYTTGLIDVYGGPDGVLLTVRRLPFDVMEMRSVDMIAEEAQLIANALINAAKAASLGDPPR